MNGLLRALVSGGVLLVSATSGVIGYATAKGRLLWFRAISDAVIRRDGKFVADAVHRSISGQALILTWQRPVGAESYWVALPGARPVDVAGCGDWSAPRLPLFFVSTLAPPCFRPIPEGPNARPDIGPADRRVILSPGRLGFQANDGARIQASWTGRAAVGQHE
jgi:hypothetical protein